MKIKKIIPFFLGSLFFSLFILSLLFCNTIDNPKYLKNKLEENNIYDKISQSIQEEMQNYIYQSGFNGEVLNDIFTIDMVKKDFNKMINSIYENKNFILDTTTLEKKLDDNIELFLQKNNILDYKQDALNNFKKEIINVYKSSIDIKSFLGNKIRYFLVLHNVFMILMFISLIGTSLVFYFLKEEWLKGISIAFFYTSMSLLFLVYFLNTNVNISSFYIFSTYISEFLSCLANSLVEIIFSLGIVFFVLGIIICIFDSHNFKLKKVFPKAKIR